MYKMDLVLLSEFLPKICDAFFGCIFRTEELLKESEFNYGFIGFFLKKIFFLQRHFVLEIHGNTFNAHPLSYTIQQKYCNYPHFKNPF